MANLSIRGLEPETAERLKEHARQRGLSVNAQVIEYIRQGLGIAGPASRRSTHQDLDHLAGTWDAAEALTIESRLEDFEAIDEELWK